MPEPPTSFDNCVNIFVGVTVAGAFCSVAFPVEAWNKNQHTVILKKGICEEFHLTLNNAMSVQLIGPFVLIFH